MITYSTAQGTLLSVLGWPRREASPEGRDVCMHVADLFRCAADLPQYCKVTTLQQKF